MPLTYPCGRANKLRLADGITVPVDDAEDAEDESSSKKSSGVGWSWSSVTSAAGSGAMSLPVEPSFARAHDLCSSLMFAAERSDRRLIGTASGVFRMSERGPLALLSDGAPLSRARLGQMPHGVQMMAFGDAGPSLCFMRSESQIALTSSLFDCLTFLLAMAAAMVERGKSPESWVSEV